MAEVSLAKAALWYARKGLVYSATQGGTKDTRLCSWAERCNHGPQRIKAWWAEDPNYNIGISCGPSGFVALDVDPKYGADPGAVAEDFGADATETLINLTPSGGMHYIYAAGDREIRNSAGKLGSRARYLRGRRVHVSSPHRCLRTSNTIREIGYGPQERAPSPLPEKLVTQLSKRKNATLAGAGVTELIPKGQRNQHLAAIAGRLRRSGMSAQEIEAALQVANTARCRPPLPQAEVRAIAGSIARYAPADPVTTSGGTSSISAADLLDMPEEEIEWLVDGILPKGGICLLSAKAKAGKSVLARNVALAVSRGGDFLGRKCHGGTVLWLALEERREDVIRDFRDMGLRRDDRIQFHFGAAPSEAYLWLERECLAHQVALAVVDTWHKMTRIENINDYAAVNLANEPLMRLARAGGVAQMWVHHNNKGEHSNGDEVLGSSALFAAADVLLSMRRANDGIRTAKTIQRVGSDMEEIVISMDPDTKLLASAGSRFVVQLATTREDVLRYLADAGLSLKDEVVKGVEGRSAIVRTALKNLCDSGEVEIEGSGLKGDPKRYRLSPSATLRFPVRLVPSQEGHRDLGKMPGPEAGTKEDHADQGAHADMEGWTVQVGEPEDDLLRYADKKINQI